MAGLLLPSSLRLLLSLLLLCRRHCFSCVGGHWDSFRRRYRCRRCCYRRRLSRLLLPSLLHLLLLLLLLCHHRHFSCCCCRCFCSCCRCCCAIVVTAAAIVAAAAAIDVASTIVVAAIVLAVAIQWDCSPRHMAANPSLGFMSSFDTLALGTRVVSGMAWHEGLGKTTTTFVVVRF